VAVDGHYPKICAASTDGWFGRRAEAGVCYLDSKVAVLHIGEATAMLWLAVELNSLAWRNLKIFSDKFGRKIVYPHLGNLSR
jgi:hypothetical protein